MPEKIFSCSAIEVPSLRYETLTDPMKSKFMDDFQHKTMIFEYFIFEDVLNCESRSWIGRASIFLGVLKCFKWFLKDSLSSLSFECYFQTIVQFDEKIVFIQFESDWFD